MNTISENTSQKLTDVRLILKDLLKVFKVVSLYPEDNPLPQSLRRTFSERLVDIIDDYGELSFGIDRENLKLGDDIVFTDRSREESLAGLFFDTGIIRIKFKTDLDVSEIYKLLDAVKTYQNSDRQTGDLAAILWEANIKGFNFETVEDVALRQYAGEIQVKDLVASDSGGYQQNVTDAPESYDGIFNAGEVELTVDPLSDTDSRIETGYMSSGDTSKEIDLHIDTPLSTGDADLDDNLKVNEAVEAMGLGDSTGPPRRLPDASLILNDELKLSEEEVDHVNRLVKLDAEFDEFESTCELLKEILHQESQMNDFYESVTICEKVLSEFVKAGKLTYAAELLRYFADLEEQLRSDRPLWSERLKDARTTAGGRERLAILCASLNQNTDIGNVELRRYLDNFNWEALMGITDMMGDLKEALHRDTVRDYLTLRGKDRVHIVAKGIADKRPRVVAASVTILARIGGDQALQQLEKVVAHPDDDVRRTLATSLAECPNDTCLTLLRRLVNDPDSSVRELAVKAIVARRGQPAFDTLTEIVNDSQFFRLEQTDQKAILVAYSFLGGDMAVDYLMRLAMRYNLFKNKTLAFYRKAAFEALAHNRGEKAERTLVKLAGSWRVDLKAQAQKALHRRRELIYGDTDDQV